jgi:hypothetical protein
VGRVAAEREREREIERLGRDVFVEFCILGLVKEKKEDRGSGGVLGPRERERERERR